MGGGLSHFIPGTSYFHAGENEDEKKAREIDARERGPRPDYLPSEKDLLTASSAIAAGVSPSLIIPAPQVNLYVNVDGGGNVKVNHESISSVTNAPMQKEGPSAIPESGPISQMYNYGTNLGGRNLK